MTQYVINSGDTAWTLMACCMALLMAPGVAFLYGGLNSTQFGGTSRSKSLFPMFFRTHMTLTTIALLWAVCGYSLAYSGDSFGFIGNLDWIFLKEVTSLPLAEYAPTIPHVLHMARESIFAVFTPALMTGIISENARFKNWLLFLTLWSLLIHVPIVHWVWSTQGWIRQNGALDFAGGMVVHMTAGIAALTCALTLKLSRDTYTKTDTSPDSGMILLGSGILTFGWLGLNGGATLRADGLAAHALVTTLLSAISGMTLWTWLEWILCEKLSARGPALGTLVGLIVISPAAGYVPPQAAISMGFLAAGTCYFFCSILKNKFQLGHAYDVFGCHGIAGTLGVLLTAIFCSKTVNPLGSDGLLLGNVQLFKTQVIAAAAIITYTAIGTYALLKLVKRMGDK